MDVIVIRHGIALDEQEALAQDIADRDRPLTKKGRKRVKQATCGLLTRVPRFAELITSPLRRATETAEIVGRVYGGLPYVENDALLPDADPPQLGTLLADMPQDLPVVVVGHEPHLSRWITWAINGQTNSSVELKKGGACRVRFEQAPAAGQGRLLWLLGPGMLRRLR